MTDITTLRELLERVERATGANRFLDQRLFAALDERWASTDRPRDLYLAPEYTRSLDATVALIDGILPKWVYLLDSETRSAQIFSPSWPKGESAEGGGATMPLALLAALLSALIAKEEMKEGAGGRS